MWVGDAFGGAEDADELVALAANAAKEAKLLENHRPGNDGEHTKKDQNAAGDPTGLSEDATEVNDQENREEVNCAIPRKKIKFSLLLERSTRLQGGQTNEMQKIKKVLPFWIHVRKYPGKRKREMSASEMPVGQGTRWTKIVVAREPNDGDGGREIGLRQCAKLQGNHGKDV